MKCLLVSLSVFVVLVMASNIGSVDGQRGVECPVYCSYEYAPVCGFNGNCYRQFGNQCSFNGEKCNRQPNLQQVEMALCGSGLPNQC